MAALDKLENSLDEVFGKNALKLPEGGKKMLVSWLPWISLIFGLLTLLSVYTLWQWANAVNTLSDNLNDFYQSIGGTNLVDDRLTVAVWVALAVAAVQALLYLAAFSPLKAHKKSGWNMLFYIALINIVYGVVVLFTDYGTIGNFIVYLIGSAIGLYFLFQIRGHYIGVAKKTTHTPVE